MLSKKYFHGLPFSWVDFCALFLECAKPMPNHYSHNYLGHAWTNSGRDARRYLTLEDRSRHMYVVGDRGTGKTTLLVHLFRQEADAGRGALYIDRKGDGAQRALAHIYRRRFNKTIYLNPSDEDFPIGFNLLGNVAPRLLSLFRSSGGR